ncbi:MAG TPA: ABC transporter substrate-binding protein [Acidimicrobiia bacterium]
MPRAYAKRAIAIGAAAALGVAGAVAPASANSEKTGVTRNSITIGMTTPLTGAVSLGYKDIAPAAEAYFDYVNDNGGINGRKVDLKVYDDQYNPAKTRQGTNQLINRDKIFAMFGALGTPTHSAVVQDLNRREIPDVFVNTGGAGFDNPRRYPMTFPYFPSYVVEAKTMAYYIDRTSSLKNKTRCLMYQAGEFGDDSKKGFKAAGMTFAEEASYTPTQILTGFTSQISSLKSANCELVVFFGVTSATAQLLGSAAKAGFSPTWMVTSVGSDPDIIEERVGSRAALNGVYTPNWIVPPQETRNPYVRLMKAIADRADLPWNFYTYYGINTAYVFAQALDAAGPNLTRSGLVNALQTESNSFRSAAVVPFRINKRSHQGLTGFYMGRYDAKGQVDRLTNYIMVGTSSASGKAKRATFRPANPTRNLLP